MDEILLNKNGKLFKEFADNIFSEMLTRAIKQRKLEKDFYENKNKMISKLVLQHLYEMQFLKMKGRFAGASFEKYKIGQSAIEEYEKIKNQIENFYTPDLAEAYFLRIQSIFEASFNTHLLNLMGTNFIENQKDEILGMSIGKKLNKLKKFTNVNLFNSNQWGKFEKYKKIRNDIAHFKPMEIEEAKKHYQHLTSKNLIKYIEVCQNFSNEIVKCHNQETRKWEKIKNEISNWIKNDLEAKILFLPSTIESMEKIVAQQIGEMLKMLSKHFNITEKDYEKITIGVKPDGTEIVYFDNQLIYVNEPIDITIIHKNENYYIEVHRMLNERDFN